MQSELYYYRIFEAYADDPAAALDKARENAANYEGVTELEATELDSRTGWIIRRGLAGPVAFGKATIKVRFAADRADDAARCLFE
ncbi:hypothetical protein [Streptomyces sp. NPDC001635]